MLDRLRRDFPSATPARWDSLAGTRLAAQVQASDERQALEAVAFPRRPFAVGAELVREGGLAEQLYIITSGWACRYRTTREGGRQIVALLVAGDIANLDTLMFGRPDFGVRVLSKADVVAIPSERLRTLAERYDGIARALMRLALIENAMLGQWALSLGRKSAQERLAHLLCELAVRTTGGDGSDGFEMPLTQEQLGDALGLTPVHVNRTMQQLRSLGLVVSAGRAFMLPDPKRLRHIGGFDPAYLRAGAPNVAASCD